MYHILTKSESKKATGKGNFILNIWRYLLR